VTLRHAHGHPGRDRRVSVRAQPSIVPPILLVEDKDSLRAMLRLALEAQGHTVVEARDQPEAEVALRVSRPAVVLSDLRLTEGDGFGVLRASKELDPELPVIVMTAFGSIQDAVAAMKEGALDFLAKPVDPDHLLLMVERALTQRRMATENLILKEELAQRRGAPQIVGEDPQLKQVSIALHRAAATDTTVLLEGESGTGKELFARALHALSPRADGPFVAINCAAIPETLLETELFGHEKGAFTGASARKPGKFELAHRGTLFLDEIGELPLSLQPKILRALEEKQFERVGGTLPLKVDVRVVAATNRHLKAAVAARQYREDLFFRLSVFPIVIPPLRERAKDIITLARYFIDRFCRELNKRPLALSLAAEQELLAYPWPGNVRELQNCIERAAILTEGDTIHPRHLSLSFRAPAVEEDVSVWSQIDLSGTMAEASRRVLGEVERRKIEQALNEAAGNRNRAAEMLQISYKLLVAKLKEYGFDAPSPTA
jgi:DNA-binding NtrC family response regulator